VRWPIICRHSPTHRANIIMFRIQVMVKNGAHISRYLIQCMMQYRGHSAPHSFIKRQWSHSLSFESLVHLLNIAQQTLGYKDLDWSKNSDDGAVFRQWLVDKKSHGVRARVDWEVIQEMFQKYGFIPFCPKVSLNCHSSCYGTHPV
jgi:hypothetical protein